METKINWILNFKLLLLILAVALSLSSPVRAEGPRAIRKQIESSMLVKGNVDIEPDGSVSRIGIDEEEKLPEGVVEFVRASGLQWRFEPVTVDGKATRARAPMIVRVVAKRLEDEQYRIEIRSASFESRTSQKGPDQIASIQVDPPHYPERAYRAGVGGTVYTILKVGRDGRVIDAFAEQVNLYVVASAGEMRQLRTLLASNALNTARDWVFRPPTEGKRASEDYWIVRVPVSYTLPHQPSESEYGRWVSYVPGPRERAPWPTPPDHPAFSPDALAAGGVYMADQQGPRLLTPLQGG